MSSWISLRRFAPVTASLFIALCSYVNISSAQGATPKEVDDALKRAKDFLYAHMNEGNWELVQQRDLAKGHWSQKNGQWGGTTALAVYGLLAAGEDPQDPRLAPAIKFLKKADIIGVYAMGMRAQVWLMLPQTPETRQLAQDEVKHLQAAFNKRGKALYLYWYVNNKIDPNPIDHSVSQYGVLGMWACAQMIETPTQYWEDVEKRWVNDQQPDGGWFYGAPNAPPPHQVEQASMTAAGVATLFITQDYVHSSEGIACRGNLKNEHIDAGLKWMADHKQDWTPDFGAGDPGLWLPGYTLYGVERIGVASGLKYFGDVDWYQYGADWCVHRQAPSGAWGDDLNIPNTAFCMLFLARGRAPVLINKISYNNTQGPDAGKPGHWNQRPRDVANFVRWMGRQTERDINWQVINLTVPEDELHDAPFLYFSGNEALSLKPEETDKLKRFIQQGGMILFNADCATASQGQSPFVASVVKLGKQIFPDYEFRDLPETHPIFTDQQYNPSRWKTKVVLKGLSNGVRELMIILPLDPAKAWQLQETVGAGREEAYQVTDNLVLYGTDKTSLRVKGQSFLIKPDPNLHPDRNIKIARLKYDGNWDPEPGGWERLGAVMHNQAKTDLTVEPLELGKKFLSGYKVAHLTGTTKFTLNSAQQKQLKDFANGGGTLIIDCAGGSSEFAESAEAMLTSLFPEGLKDPLPPGDAIYKNGVPKTEIHYRHYARTLLGSVRTPQVKAISINGRNAVFYSREDLSGGLVGEPMGGIIGYDPESSSEIMSAIILGTPG